MIEDDLAPGKYLNALAVRCTPELVGNAVVHVRHLDEVTWKLWDDFDGHCKKKFNNDDARAPRSIATTVLSVISGGYVHFSPDRRAPFLASLNPIDNALLRRVFTLTHYLALGQEVGMIDLTAPPELARRIADTTENKYLLADHLQPVRNSQPTAPGWLFRTVAWELAERLASQPWSVSEDRAVTLRPDSTGGLVAFDDPWQNEQGGRYARSRTALRLKTVPNIHNPVLMLSS